MLMIWRVMGRCLFSTMLTGLLLSSVTLMASGAEGEATAVQVEEVVVIGSRRAGRSATDSPVPVDVVSGEDFRNMGSSDMDDMLRNLLPSYNVQRFSTADAAIITRPATLRGLPPDNTLVLVNGKRRHRAAVIAELGGSLAAGSQGPDISVIPAVAIDRVEVLRDGAAAQYGSDAIAGVINYRLKENNQGLTLEGKWGETFEGDGDLWVVAGNVGLPLGDDGFASVSMEWASADPTSRSLPRTDAQALIDTGYMGVRQPAQIYGSPEVDDDVALFVNAGIDLSDSQTLYGFGNYAERAATNGFFYRNPNARSGVFTSGSQRAILDLNLAGQTGQTSNCPVLTSPGSTPTDQAAVDADLAALAALPSNCWVANNLYPGGYTPSFGGDVEDISAVVGLRGSLNNGLTYDFSIGLGRNETAFRISNTWNPSLGPTSPTEFDLGTYVQVEQQYNADFTFPVQVDAFASDLNVAFGAEYRVETFKVLIGEEASWDAGPWAFQGTNFHSDGVTPLVPLSIGAHGFAGFSPSQAGEFDRANYAVYLDLGADLTENFLVELAFRFEDFDDFGTTTNGKVQARWNLTPTFGLRGSFSTGFRAPTPGQSNVTKVSTIAIDNELQQRGQIPPTNPIALFLGGEALDAEDATNLTFGAAWDLTNSLTVTLDYYNIEVQDRITQTGSIIIAGEPAIADCPATLAAGGNLAACLQELGVPGAADLNSVSFFTNDFDTTTQGVDLVATYVQDWGDAGITNFTAAWNWTETEVDRAGSEVSRDRVVELENYNPQHRGIFTVNHFMGNFRFLARASFYDDWVDASYSGDPAYSAGGNDYRISCERPNDNCYDGDWIVDVEAGYTFNDRYTVVAGVQNLFNEFGPKDLDNTARPGFSNAAGRKYSQTTPFGFDGGLYYFRFRVDLN